MNEDPFQKLARTKSSKPSKSGIGLETAAMNEPVAFSTGKEALDEALPTPQKTARTAIGLRWPRAIEGTIQVAARHRLAVL